MNQISPAPVDVCLDHAGFIVRDLDATCNLMAQLGFTQTVRAEHTRTNEQGLLVSAGSAQRSIMLGNGYIEVMQITDPLAGHQLALAPTARFGLHVVAFGTPDAVACQQQCVHNGVAAGPVLYWARQVNEEGLRGLAQFAYFGSAWKPHDPSYLCWVEQRTPELLRSPALLRHDNRALGLAELHYRGPRRQALPWIERLLAAGMRLACERGSGVELSLPNACMQIDFDEGDNALLPSALVFDLSDCAWLRARCAELGLQVRDQADGGFDLDLVQQLGMHCIFQPAQGRAR